ncbi:MAG: hypothetical protein K6A32_04440 [Bacteroidales bacterium]|nr:hypothetical protein [Bacteroidales bacterium]
MKTLCLSVLFFLSASVAAAQTEDSAVAEYRGTVAIESIDTLPTHILFEGIEVKGDIYEFSEVMQKNGYKLKKRLGNEQQFIFQGPVCGHNSYIQASYTKHTRTVFRVLVQPKHVSQNDYLDSLKVRYGEVFDETERGYQWMTPAGAVMFFTPDGYDPTLVIMDGEGVAAYKEEEDRPRMR